MKEVKLWHLHPFGVMISAIEGDQITISISDFEFNEVGVLPWPERKPSCSIHAPKH